MSLAEDKCRCYGEGCYHCTGVGAICEVCGCYLDDVRWLRVDGLRYCRPDGVFAMGLDALDSLPRELRAPEAVAFAPVCVEVDHRHRGWAESRDCAAGKCSAPCCTGRAKAGA